MCVCVGSMQKSIFCAPAPLPDSQLVSERRELRAARQLERGRKEGGRTPLSDCESALGSLCLV